MVSLSFTLACGAFHVKCGAVLANERTLKLVGGGLPTHDIEDLILECRLPMGTNSLLQKVGPLFHACMIDVLAPASSKGLPIGPTVANRETDVLLARERVSKAVHKVITVIPALALGGLGAGF